MTTRVLPHQPQSAGLPRPRVTPRSPDAGEYLLALTGRYIRFVFSDAISTTPACCLIRRSFPGHCKFNPKSRSVEAEGAGESAPPAPLLDLPLRFPPRPLPLGESAPPGDPPPADPSLLV